MLNQNNFYLNLNNLIFNYKTISIADFSFFIENNRINSKNTLTIVFFLILKNNRNFWQLILDNLDFNIQSEDYLPQLQLLKTFNTLIKDFSNNLEKSLLESGLNFNDALIQQVFFDLSLLSNLDNELLYTKKININNIMLSAEPLAKFNIIKIILTKKQQKQLFLACLSHFRTSSIFILNDLFNVNTALFSKKIILKHFNIFSQCNIHIQSYIFNFLIALPVKQAFKTGTQLAYTQFSDDILIDFFNSLYLRNSELFFLFSSGFISNPQQHKPFIINYLIKKKTFIKLNERLLMKNEKKSKTTKI